jgi:hypothetical protein
VRDWMIGEIVNEIMQNGSFLENTLSLEVCKGGEKENILQPDESNEIFLIRGAYCGLFLNTVEIVANGKTNIFKCSKIRSEEKIMIQQVNYLKYKIIVL